MTKTNADIIEVESPLPEIVGVKPLDRFRVEVIWTTGRKASVDLAPDIFTFKAYAPLREDRALFESVHVVDEGNAIAWAEGAIDMPATAVERLAEDIMTAQSLRTFMQDASLTRDGLAAQLGVSRRLVGYWLEGQAIPRYIALACRSLSG